MDLQTAIDTVKQRLNITDSSRDLLINDVVVNALNYMNLSELPDALEPFIRGKVKAVIDYEAQFGEGNVLNVTSQTEGKCSWTYSLTDSASVEGVYGFSAKDFQQLRRFRTVRR